MKKWHKESFFLLLACSLIAACGAGKVPASQMDKISNGVRGSWAASPEARAGIDSRWVQRIGGNEGRRLVELAWIANPDLRIAAERVQRAVATAKVAGAALKPEVTAGLSGQRQRDVFIGLPFGGETPVIYATNWGANLNVNWEADLWGRVRAGQSAALADLGAEAAGLQAAKVSLAAQVLRSWLAACEASEQIRLAIEANELRKTTLDLVYDRFTSALTADGGSAAEYRLAETEMESGKAVLAQRKGERDQAVRQLEVLLARHPAGRLPTGAKLPKLPPFPPAGLPSGLLQRRPDILQAERRFAASERRQEAARVAFFPTLRLTASAGRSSNELRELLDSNFGEWALGGGITQPIFNAGRLKAEKARADSDVRADLARLQQTVLRAFGEVEQALAADRFLADRQAATVRALISSQEAVQSARENYVAGTGDVLTVINAERSRVGLAAQEVSLRRLRLDNRVTLHLALGGSYQTSK